MEKEQKEERELVPVPVRRREKAAEEEMREKVEAGVEAEVREMPRRWYVY